MVTLTDPIKARVKVLLLRPERWWSIREEAKARGNPGGRPQRYWRANRSSDLRIASKESSNHLVAGSHRSFPQDCSVLKKKLTQSHLVKRMIRSLRSVSPILDLFSNFKRVRSLDFSRKLRLYIKKPFFRPLKNDWKWFFWLLMVKAWSGPDLVSRNGDGGWTKRRGLRCPNQRAH